MQLKIGECFVLGFRGPTVPTWLHDFEARFGLGGIILFDYDVQTKTYHNNVESKEQVQELCRELHALASHPLIVIDQEGGKVRRFKERLGFAPLVSAEAFDSLSLGEKQAMARASFRELKSLGIDINLAPVVDLNTNAKNPDIGAIGRSYSADPARVRSNVEVVNAAAQEVGLGLCLKHYPGLGGAVTNSHLELTDLTGTFDETQLQLFYEWGKKIFGQSVLVSHGLVKNWEPRLPTSMSISAIENLRAHLPDALLISDDIQMQGLQALLPSSEAVLQGLRAGLDWIIIGNNLIDEQERVAQYAERLSQEAKSDKKLTQKIESSIMRVKNRKRILARRATA